MMAGLASVMMINSGLGDWQVNEKKFGCTLSELAGAHPWPWNEIRYSGMSRNVYFRDSDLYRAHPDWAFTVPGRRPTPGRNQL